MDDRDLPPLTVGPDGPDGPLRAKTLPDGARRVGGIGLGVALAGGLVVGVLAGSGRTAVAAVCVGAALVVGLTAIVSLVAAVRDEHRGQRVPARRIAVAVALLVASPVLLVLAAGAAGTA